MPYHLGIAELRAVDVVDGISLERFESIAAVAAVSDILRLHASGRCVHGNGVDRHDAIVLVGEEAACIVRVHNSRSAIYEGGVARRPQCDFLVLPVVQIAARSVTCKGAVSI